MGLGELILPRECAGCRVPGTVLCGACRYHLRSAPHRIVRPRDLGLPVFAMGPYSDIRRNIIIAMKARGNREVRELMGAVFAAGLEHLQAQGQLPINFDLVPAPTRAQSARLRGGDPVTAMARAAAKRLTGVEVARYVETGRAISDQSDLSAGGRWLNMDNAVQLRTGIVIAHRDIVLIDDVVTTGATMAATARKLQVEGVKVWGGIVLADA